MKLLDIFEDDVTISSKVSSNLKVDNDTANDKVSSQLLKDIETAAKKAGVVVTITTAKTGHPSNTSGKGSRHQSNDAVDVSIINGIGSKGATNGKNGNPRFRELGNKLKDALVSLGYVWNGSERGGQPKVIYWQTNTGGNHFNHLHISNTGGGPSSTTSSTTSTTSDTTSDTTSQTSSDVGGLGILDNMLNNTISSIMPSSVKENIDRIKDLLI